MPPFSLLLRILLSLIQLLYYVVSWCSGCMCPSYFGFIGLLWLCNFYQVGAHYFFKYFSAFLSFRDFNYHHVRGLDFFFSHRSLQLTLGIFCLISLGFILDEFYCYIYKFIDFFCYSRKYIVEIIYHYYSFHKFFKMSVIMFFKFLRVF